MFRKNAFRFFSAGMGALATAGAVTTSYMAKTYCPDLNSSTNTLIDPITNGPLSIEGSIDLDAKIYKFIDVDINSTDVKGDFWLKTTEQFLHTLNSLPGTAETTCKVALGIVGSLLTLNTMMSLAVIGFVGKKVYDYASEPSPSTRHENDFEADLRMPLAII